MRPNALIVRSYLLRGAQLWGSSRILLSAAFLLAGASPLGLGLTGVVGVILLNVALGFVETNRRRERALLGNLGVRTSMLMMLFAVPAIVGELALRLVTATIR